MGGSITIVAARDAFALTSVSGGAGVLLQGSVGDAACATGGWSITVLTVHDDRVTREVPNPLNIGDRSRGGGNEP